jgi:hypothetical protein
MKLTFPRILGEIHDKDTKASAFVKQNQEYILIGGVILILAIAYLIYSLSLGGTRQGTWRYGLCHVFLNQYLQYPDSLEVLSARERPAGAEIRYLYTTPYGGQKSEEMECFYTVSGNFPQLARVTVDRKSLNLLSETQSNERPKDDEASEPIQNAQAVFELFDSKNGLGDDVARVTIESFNQSIPILLEANDFETRMPAHMPEEIIDLKYN